MKQIQLYPLKNNKVMIVDENVYYEVNSFKWTLGNNGYAYREVWNKMSRTKIPLHRLLAKAKKGEVVDHKNCDKLDNRVENLRICTQSDNCKNQIIKSNNKSGFKGVSWDKRASRWSVFITHNYKHIFGGYFTNKIEAAKKYNELAHKYHREFKRINVC